MPSEKVKGRGGIMIESLQRMTEVSRKNRFSHKSQFFGVLKIWFVVVTIA
jgi:hypothetical protein